MAVILRRPYAAEKPGVSRRISDLLRTFRQMRRKEREAEEADNIPDS
jgi:hypothetical protein